MPLDAFCLTALKNELCNKITGLKIDKVQQPERDELILSLRGPGVSIKLLISAGTGDARIHETRFSYENPSSPPMFCMLLRKHLTGARILNITQPHLERQLDISLSVIDQMGDVVEKHIILELMGRFSNIILTGADGIIIDCMRRVDSEMSPLRQLMPGMLYRLPPAQNKLDPTAVSQEEFEKLLAAASSDAGADKWLLSTFCALSPLVCREIAASAYGHTDIRMGDMRETDGGAALKNSFFSLQKRITENEFTPCMLSDENGKPVDFSYFPIMQYGAALKSESVDSFSELMELFYSRRASAERVRQRSSAMTKTVKNALERVRRKLVNQRTELLNTEDREKLRMQGDIITANLWNMKKGQSVLTAQNFYDPDGAMCEIKLDPLKTPQQNAAKYYKDYAKAKTAEKYLTEQIAIAEREEEYLSSVLDEISRADGESDLAEIRHELEESGYSKQQKQQKRQKRPEPKPMRFRSSAGVEIRVGKNNAQNDALTLKNSYKTDVWLHAQKIHGSHVVISTGGGEPDDVTLSEAASLAAFYSQGRDAGRVPVDYALIKHVKKPNGAKPGMVIYTDYKTVIARPDEALAEKLRIK